MNKREAIATLIRAKRMEMVALGVFIPEKIKNDFSDIKNGIIDGLKESIVDKCTSDVQVSESKIHQVDIK